MNMAVHDGLAGCGAGVDTYIESEHFLLFIHDPFFQLLDQQIALGQLALGQFKP